MFGLVWEIIYLQKNLLRDNQRKHYWFFDIKFYLNIKFSLENQVGNTKTNATFRHMWVGLLHTQKSASV